MNTALAIGFATTGATLFVTIGLFILDRSLARRRERREVRRLLVTRVLDAFDASTRQLLRPVFVQAWSNSDVEYALLTPRLLLDLNGSDRWIVPWLQRQIQHMQLSVTKKERIAIRAMVADRLLQWHLGAIKPPWFVDQLAKDPVAKNFAVPHTVKLRQSAATHGDGLSYSGSWPVPFSSFGKRSPSSSRRLVRPGLLLADPNPESSTSTSAGLLLP